MVNSAPPQNDLDTQFKVQEAFAREHSQTLVRYSRPDI